MLEARPVSFWCVRSLLATAGPGLALLLATRFLHAVLGVLLTASASTGLASIHAGTLQAVFGLKLFHLVQALVDEAKARAAATPECCFEAKQLDALHIVDLVHGFQLLGQILLGHIGHAWVDDVQHELLASQQRVRLELTGADGE